MSLITVNPDKSLSYDPSVDFHLGRIALKTLRDYPDDIHQIEIINDEVETNASVLLRSIRLAESLKKRGVVVGDTIMLCGVNHNDICIVVIASLFLGTTIQPLSNDMTEQEICHTFSLGLPKIVFCDEVIAQSFTKAATHFKHDVEIVVFKNIPKTGRYSLFSDLLVPTGTEDCFEVTDYDPDTTTGFIIFSSGSTGLPKGVCFSYKTMAFTLIMPAQQAFSEAGDDRQSLLSYSTLYWISGVIGILSPCILRVCHYHCIENFSVENVSKGLMKYKPTMVYFSPVSAHEIVKDPRVKDIDFSSVRIFFSGGSSIAHEVVLKLQEKLVNGSITVSYGMTEASSICIAKEYKMNSVGKMNSWIHWKIVDPDTNELIDGPHKVGELRIKYDHLFKGYYNNPAETDASYDENNWFKTGDLVYYDDEEYFYIVDRIKQTFKFRNFQIAPFELENEISKVPGVLVSAVVGIPHPQDDQHPMAFVQLCKGAKVSAQTIKDAVKNALSENKQLRGGVVFIDKMPLSFSGKISKKELNILKMTAKPE